MDLGFPQQWVLPRKQWSEGPQGNPYASMKQHHPFWDKEALQSSTARPNPLNIL